MYILFFAENNVKTIQTYMLVKFQFSYFKMIMKISILMPKYAKMMSSQKHFSGT